MSGDVGREGGDVSLLPIGPAHPIERYMNTRPRAFGTNHHPAPRSQRRATHIRVHASTPGVPAHVRASTSIIPHAPW